MFGSLIRKLTAVIYFSLSSSISLFVILLISIFLTWLVRGWLLVSGQAEYAFPTNFVFEPCIDRAGVCSYPYALINLRRSRPYSKNVEKTSILTPGLEYSAALRFRLADSESNRLAGMFMLRFSLQTALGRELSVCTTSTMMPYRSMLIRFARRLILWPFMIFGYFQEYHWIHVKCPEPLSYFPYDGNDNGESTNTASRLRVEIQNVAVQLSNNHNNDNDNSNGENAGVLELSAHLRGLQYYLYWWPITSSCVLFGAIFWFNTSLSCAIWLIRYLNNYVANSKAEKEAAEEDDQNRVPSPPTSPNTWKKNQRNRKFSPPTLNRVPPLPISSTTIDDNYDYDDMMDFGGDFGDRPSSPSSSMFYRQHSSTPATGANRRTSIPSPSPTTLQRSMAATDQQQLGGIGSDSSCFQRRLSSRMQRALLDLDDSNLGS